MPPRRTATSFGTADLRSEGSAFDLPLFVGAPFRDRLLIGRVRAKYMTFVMYLLHWMPAERQRVGAFVHGVSASAGSMRRNPWRWGGQDG